MIIPKRLKIHNYSQIGSAEVELGPGVYFITGENRDEIMQSSNGAGKSLFCSTFVWCLFEDILRKGLRRDDIIGPSDDHTIVEIEFDVDGQSVVVTRFRNHPTYGHDVHLMVDGVDQTHIKKAETLALIEQKLGVNRDVLYYCAYTHAQGEPIVGLSSSRLNDVVSQIINTDRYDTWIKNVRTNRRTNESNQDLIRVELDSVEKQIKICNNDIASLKSQLEEFETNKEANIIKIKNDIAEAKRDIEDFGKILESEDDDKERLKELETLSNYIEAINVTNRESARKLEECRNQLRKAEARLKQAEVNTEVAKDRINNLVNNPSGKCDACGNYIKDSEDVADLVKKYQNDLNKYETLRIEEEVAVRKHNDNVILFRNRLASGEESVEELKPQLDEYYALKRKVEDYKRARQFYNRAREREANLRQRLKSEQERGPDSIEQSLNIKVSHLKDLLGARAALQEAFDDGTLTDTAYRVLEGSIRAVKASRFNSFIVDFRDAINKYLNDLTDGDYHCELAVNGNELSLKFTSASKHGKYYHYDVFSQGEQARIAKAASAALNSIMNLGFIIDDEGLNGLDDPGIESVLEFVIKANEGKALFFVGHQKAIYDYFEDATNLHMVKEDGITRVEVR